MPRSATAKSIGSAMFLAYDEAGREARVMSDTDYAEQCANRRRLPNIPAVILARETTWEVRPVKRGRLCEPSLVIHLTGDALKDPT